MSTGGPVTRSRVRSSNTAEQHEELRQIISQALAPMHEKLKALPRKAVIEEMTNNAVKKLEEKIVAQDRKINLLQNRIAVPDQGSAGLNQGSAAQILNRGSSC